MVTAELLHSIYPTTPQAKLAQYVEPLNHLLPANGINTPNKIAGFLSQVGHESAGFTASIENLNYGAQGLRSIFGKYFPNQALADAYARKPEKIANRVYANRMGNRDEASGDGWKYRGKGLIQLTGHDNHALFAEACDMSIDEAILYLETPMGAVHSAVWFWTKTKCNRFLDLPNGGNDIVGLTRSINGGTNGLADRQNHFEAIRRALR